MRKPKRTPEEKKKNLFSPPQTDRHPHTGELISDIKPWQDDEGNWLPTEFNEKTKSFKVIASGAKQSPAVTPAPTKEDK